MLEIVLSPMALETQTFTAGDTVRVTVSFKYAVGVNTSVRLYAGPYSTNLFGKHMIDTCVGAADVSLPAASSPTPATATIDFMLIAKSLGGIDNGTYGLRVWVEDTDALAEQDNVIIVTGNTLGSSDTLSSMMPMLMMVMMLGMMAPMMQGLGGTEE